MNKKLETLDFNNIRERFYTEYETDNTGWPKTHVKVFDNQTSTTKPIYEYDRNYVMSRTFEPFRLWDEKLDKWRNFALISKEYTNFEVLDLDKKEIIAKNPPLIIDQETADSLNESYIKNNQPIKYHAGDDMSGFRFCPIQFHVPDIFDILNKEEMFKDIAHDAEQTLYVEWLDKFFEKRSFGYEAGCVWGDDYSMKVQAIELSGILEGEVSDDDRFGYIELQGELQNIYNKDYYDSEYDMSSLSLNVPVSFKMNSGKVVKSQTYSTIEKFTYED